MWRALTVSLLISLVSASIAAAPKDFSVTLQVPEVVTAVFHSVAGMSIETEVLEFRDGSTGTIRKIPGLVKYGDITLKRGATRDRSLWAWKEMVDAGHTGGVNGFIILSDRSGSEIARWSFVAGWPKSVKLELDAETGLATESISIVVEGLERQ